MLWKPPDTQASASVVVRTRRYCRCHNIQFQATLYSPEFKNPPNSNLIQVSFADKIVSIQQGIDTAPITTYTFSRGSCHARCVFASNRIEQFTESVICNIQCYARPDLQQHQFFCPRAQYLTIRIGNTNIVYIHMAEHADNLRVPPCSCSMKVAKTWMKFSTL